LESDQKLKLSAELNFYQNFSPV